VCVNSASTVLRGADNNGEIEENTKSRSSRVRRGVNKRLIVIAFDLPKKPVYSTDPVFSFILVCYLYLLSVT